MSDGTKSAAPVAAAAPAPPPPAPAAKPPPKNPGMVTFTVDGREVVAKPGTNMIEAAKQVGIDIPYYCYHHRLSIAANCRMCLVEAPGPRLMPACQTAISEGLSVKTTTSAVRSQQRAVMEFLLLNHPVDCSICDQAGECKLQDYYMRYDHKPSRLEGPKVLRNKRKVLGPTVVLDQERCILCTRCVRFMAEVAKEPQLGVFGRGSHERIDVFPHESGLTSNYSGNVVDICPVGALLSRDFRFRARAWFLSTAPTLCTGCSKGCSTYVDFLGQDVYRYRPRENEAINQSWMCDKGRVTYQGLNKHRLLQAVLGSGAEGREAHTQEAAKLTALEVRKHQGAFAALISPTLSNEDLLAALTFSRDVLKATAFYVTGRPSGEADALLMSADKNPNRKGLEWIARGLGITLLDFAALTAALEQGKHPALYAFGSEVPEAPEAFAQRLAQVKLFVLQATVDSTPITQAAQVALPAASHVEDEGTFTNHDGVTQRVRRAFPPRGEAQPHWKWTALVAAELGQPVGYASAREVFKSLAPQVPELKDFPWDKLAPMNQKGRGVGSLPSSADGRPPGYREQGIPRVRGI